MYTCQNPKSQVWAQNLEKLCPLAHGQKDNVLPRNKNYRENWTDEQKQREKERWKRRWDNNKEEIIKDQKIILKLLYEN